MNKFRRSVVALGLLVPMILPETTLAETSGEAAPPIVVTVPSEPMVATEPAGPQAAGPQPASATPPTSLSVPVTLPQPFEVTISSIAALATGAGAALKTNRSDARTLAIRLALSQALVSAASAKKPVGSITLGTKSGALEDKNKNESLADEVMLCGKREDFIEDSVYLNYLNSLVQNINAVSVKAAAPTDIPSALKLLLATTNYSISDKVQIDAAALNDLVSKVKTNCERDLSTYAEDYYGIKPSGALPAPVAAAAGGVTTFSFLGPIGTLVDTFLSILQPVLINWATLVDELRRQQAIIYALSDKNIQAKINTTGEALAEAIDKFSAQSRHNATGAFVEQLVSIREMNINLSGVADCDHLSTSDQTNGEPSLTFMGCFSTAWSKIQKDVANLNTIGDNYDTLADANTVSAKTLFGKIMKDWAAIEQAMAKNGGIAVYTQTFLSDLTQFITFAEAIAGAASKSNLSALNKAAAAVAK